VPENEGRISMYEFHGWATIRNNYSSLEGDEDNIDFIVKELKKCIEKLQMLNWIFDIKVFNGNHHLIVSGFTNHSYPASEQVFGVYNLIGQIAPASYGMLYIHDDEDKRGFENDFRVHVLSKGIIVEKADPFLSPFIPTVEDVYF
jgi:hypothetical protein